MQTVLAGCSSMEEDRFFDSRDEVCSVSDLQSDVSEAFYSSSLVNSALGYEFWTRKLESVDERRSRFLKWMGLNPDWRNINEDELGDSYSDETKLTFDRLRDDNDAVLANLDSEDQFFSGRSSYSGWSNKALDVEEDGSSEENLSWKIRNLDDGTEFIVDEFGQDGMLSRLREVGSDRTLSFEEFQRTLGSSPLVQHFLKRDSEDFSVNDSKKKVKRGWLWKLSGVTCKADRKKGVNVKPYTINSKMGTSVRRVRVHSAKKQSKELSSLCIGQDFPAHEGSILTMKFSPDGQFLASAGKDGIVRVWKVIEDENLEKFNIQDTDPSCLYFSVNDFCKVAPLTVDKEKIAQIKKLRKSSESACVILPPKVFHILEKPIHEFHGHRGEVLALSWSKNGYLLSSSVDKTARLWQVGGEQCVGVYAHNNYVTCIEFNPVDDNYFISGSIDGKVRIWEVHECRVVDWTDIREIVSAVCFCPDGKGGIVGSMDGNCRFYDIKDNRLELGAQISLPGKKLTGKRITGFQFCPSDSRKVMVTSADSQVRILFGSNVICKFKGVRHSGSQAPASFTPDGKHVLSTTEDSKVYIWNYTNQDRTSSRAKNIWSCESFSSHNASIAIPWCGLKTDTNILPEIIVGNEHCDENLLKTIPSSFPDCFSLSHRFFLDSMYKGSATWPEEKLPNSPVSAVSPLTCRSEFKFLKSALQSAFTNPHLWGLVVVTAGWDGCIRTFLNYGLPMRF